MGYKIFFILLITLSLLTASVLADLQISKISSDPTVINELASPVVYIRENFSKKIIDHLTNGVGFVIGGNDDNGGGFGGHERSII